MLSYPTSPHRETGFEFDVFWVCFLYSRYSEQGLLRAGHGSAQGFVHNEPECAVEAQTHEENAAKGCGCYQGRRPVRKRHGWVGVVNDVGERLRAREGD